MKVVVGLYIDLFGYRFRIVNRPDFFFFLIFFYRWSRCENVEGQSIFFIKEKRNQKAKKSKPNSFSFRLFFSSCTSRGTTTKKVKRTKKKTKKNRFFPFLFILTFFFPHFRLRQVIDFLPSFFFFTEFWIAGVIT